MTSLTKIRDFNQYYRLCKSSNECFGYVSFISNGTACYGYNFCIHMEHRGKGLGKLVIAELFNYLPTDQMLYLISAYEGPTMKQAKHLYEKVGFQTYESNPDLRKKVTVLNIEQEKPAPKSKL